VITVNDSIADELARRYGVPRPVVVRNCPRTVGPAPRREASPLRGRAGVPAEAPILLYQGMFMPYRGLENLVRSVRGITRAHLVLLGWGPLRDSLSALARAEGVAHRVRFLEGVPLADLLAWTAGADVGAIPTRHVGLNNYFTTPNKLFEYCAAGVPVVASRFPELSRYVDGLGLGRTFDPESPLDIAAAVNALLDDPGALARARANVARAAAGLTWEAESRVLLEIYAGLGTSAPPGREGTAEAAGGDRRPAS
jgi:glycosyltransferase involved in cell wall biosynthesis